MWRFCPSLASRRIDHMYRGVFGSGQRMTYSLLPPSILASAITVPREANPAREFQHPPLISTRPSGDFQDGVAFGCILPFPLLPLFILMTVNLEAGSHACLLTENLDSGACVGQPSFLGDS